MDTAQRLGASARDPDCMDTVEGPVTVNGTSASRQGGRFRSEWSVAGAAAAWQDVEVSLSAGEIVPDRKLSLPPHSEIGSRRDGMRIQIWKSPVCLIFNVVVRPNRTVFG